MATVIDALVVTLGLDGGPYKRAARQAEREQNRLRDSTKKSSNEISDALKGVGLTVGKLLLGFEGIKGAINYFAGLNVATAELGRFSRNIGQSAHEVNTWDSAVELAGGTAKEAQGDLASLSASLTNLQATGSVSELLLLFQRQGIALTDAQGKAKGLTQLYLELGDSLRKYSRQNAFNLAKGAGISEGTFNLIRAEADERDRLLRTAEENNNVTEESVKQAQMLQEQWRNIGQAIKGVAQVILTTITPAIQTALEWLQGLFNGAQKGGPVLNFIVGAFKAMGGALKVVVNLLRTAWNGLNLLFGAVGNTRFGKWVMDKFGSLSDFGAAFVDASADLANSSDNTRAAAKQEQSSVQNNNPGNIRFANQRSAIGADSRGFAIFPTLQAGILEATRQLDLYSKRGINTIGAIVNAWAPASDRNNVPAYIAALSKSTGKGANDQLSAADRANLLKGIFDHEGAGKVAPELIRMLLGGANVGPGAAGRFASGQSAPGALGASNSSTSTVVHIDELNVHTKATDAKGLAADLPGQLKRGGVVTQADSGMS